jgi:cytoskeletal protein CcmA (bactofilin family)
MSEILRRSLPESVRNPEFHVAANVWIRGDVEAPCNGRVEGTVEGAITLVGRSLTIDRKGQVLGDVRASKVVVHGRLKGDVTASESIEIADGAVVEGTVNSPTLVLAEGAVLQGQVATQSYSGPGGDNVLKRSPWSLREGKSPSACRASNLGPASIEPIDRLP